jgi:hypothetical protein
MDDVEAPDTPMPENPLTEQALTEQALTEPGVDAVDELPPHDVPEPPQTGDQAVDEAVLRLAAAAHEPLETQVTAFDAAHRALQDRLADVES